MTKTRKLVTAYVVIAVLFAWPLTSAMFYREKQAFWRDGERDYHVPAGKWWMERRRHELGEAVAMGLLFSLIWPIGVPSAWASTGFAEAGIVRLAPETP